MTQQDFRIEQLYPAGQSREVGVSQLYLRHQLHRRGEKTHPFVYTNYVTSLDGRIALEYPHSGHSCIPSEITSASIAGSCDPRASMPT